MLQNKKPLVCLLLIPLYAFSIRVSSLWVQSVFDIAQIICFAVFVISFVSFLVFKSRLAAGILTAFLHAALAVSCLFLMRSDTAKQQLEVYALFYVPVLVLIIAVCVTREKEKAHPKKKKKNRGGTFNFVFLQFNLIALAIISAIEISKFVNSVDRKVDYIGIFYVVFILLLLLCNGLLIHKKNHEINIAITFINVLCCIAIAQKVCYFYLVKTMNLPFVEIFFALFAGAVLIVYFYPQTGKMLNSKC